MCKSVCFRKLQRLGVNVVKALIVRKSLSVNWQYRYRTHVAVRVIFIILILAIFQAVFVEMPHSH